MIAELNDSVRLDELLAELASPHFDELIAELHADDMRLLAEFYADETPKPKPRRRKQSA